MDFPAVDYLNMRWLLLLTLLPILLTGAKPIRSTRLSAWMAAVKAKKQITATAKRVIECPGGKCPLPENNPYKGK